MEAKYSRVGRNAKETTKQERQLFRLKEDLKKYPLYTYIDLSRTCRFKYPFILHSDLNGKFSL